MKHIYFTLACILLLASCAKDDFDFGLTPGQESLIGRAVNFDASVVDAFATKATYIDNGGFNDGDRMYILRHYRMDDGTYDETAGAKSYRVYSYDYYRNNRQRWGVLPGKTGSEGLEYFTQTVKDSLVWDNAKTVRFRSITRSNFAGSITASRSAYYPDYCLSDWISSGGPTLNIPMELKHLGSRIVVSPRNNGTQLSAVEICLDWQDYKRADNNDTNTHDDEETAISDALAQERAAAVAAVYNRMCMPSGINMLDESMFAMPKDYYDAHPGSGPVNGLEDVETEIHDTPGATFAHVPNNTLTAAEVTAQVQRPVFNRLNNSCYLITIPYDISTDDQGEILVLPPFTRFKVRLYDVNNGDLSTAPGVESEYHILCLTDITDGSGQPKYPDGLEFRPGRSFRFNVGYRYQHLEITDASDLAWDAQTAADENAPVDVQSQPDNAYAWWVNAMDVAAETAMATGDFSPDFQIDDQMKFLSFTSLVNGTASTKNGTELVHAWTRTGIFGAQELVEGWYDENETIAGDTTWVRLKKTYTQFWNNPDYVNSATFDFEDYIFFDRFYPQNGDVPAYVVEEYVSFPFSFYDIFTNQTLKVVLAADLDMADWRLEPVGNDAANPFQGNFDGGNHTLSEVNVRGGCLFGYVDDACIRNLYVESTHNTALADAVSGVSRIAGISMKTNATGASLINSIADSTTIVVGCIHEGTSGTGMVGTAAKGFTMYACMEAGTIQDGTYTGGALCGNNAAGVLAPQPGDKDVKWGRFMCNYYDKTHNPLATAVGGTADAYRPGEYIRGYKSSILKAHVDNMLPAKADYNPNYYGHAAFRAMNAAIRRYNEVIAGTDQTCNAKYTVSDNTFDYLYPELEAGAPDEHADIDIPAEKS